MTFRFLLAVLFLFVSTASFSYEAGDIVVRAGLIVIDPQEKSDTVFGNDGLGAASDTRPGISGTYMLNSNFGVELIAALPFEHTVVGTGALAGLKVATVKHLPPTLSLQYYPNLGSDKFTPYAGVGYNHTIFFDEETNPELTTALGASATYAEVSDSTGLAFHMGADVSLAGGCVLNLSITSVDLDTTAKVYRNGDKVPTVITDVELDPLVYGVGLTKVF